MPVRFQLPASTVLDADGNGTATLTARGTWDVMHTRVTVGPAPGQTRVVRQPRALLYLNGTEFEGTYAGSNSQSDTQHQMQAGESIECRWTGGDAGATATLYVRGMQS